MLHSQPSRKQFDFRNILQPNFAAHWMNKLVIRCEIILNTFHTINKLAVDSVLLIGQEHIF